MTRSSKPSHFTATEAEHALIDRAATHRGLTRSEFVRHAAVDAAERTVRPILEMLRDQPQGTFVGRIAGASWDEAIRKQQTGRAKAPKAFTQLQEGMVGWDGARVLVLDKRFHHKPPAGEIGEYWAYHQLSDGETAGDGQTVDEVPGIIVLPWIDPAN